ncbi:MAG: type II toxin-antitoxin system VapC family toxin [Candidatus Korobacteraceae bacterium]
MIVLDTNVASELMRATPDHGVLNWIDKYPATELFTTAITVAEVYFGIELLPRGKRREELLSLAEAIFDRDFLDRTLAFDADSARIFSRIAAQRRGRGRPISQSDAQIAAIVQRHGAMLATRNIADFESCGIRLLDPWQS